MDLLYFVRMSFLFLENNSQHFISMFSQLLHWILNDISIRFILFWILHIFNTQYTHIFHTNFAFTFSRQKGEIKRESKRASKMCVVEALKLDTALFNRCESRICSATHTHVKGNRKGRWLVKTTIEINKKTIFTHDIAWNDGESYNVNFNLISIKCASDWFST